MSVTRLQFPPQSGSYAIRVKEGDPWHTYDTLRLEISVGQDYHEGEKFSCTIDWAKARFKNIVILCNDTLQRYNFSLNSQHDPQYFRKQTEQDGLNWLKRNKQSLAGIKVVHWDHWLDHPDFAYAIESARDTYRENNHFRSAVDQSISSVYERRLKRNLIKSRQKERFYQLSLDYLMEETACLALAYQSHPGISAYPGSFLEMWRMFVDRETPQALIGLSNSHCIRIDFARRKSEKNSAFPQPIYDAAYG